MPVFLNEFYGTYQTSYFIEPLWMTIFLCEQKQPPGVALWGSCPEVINKMTGVRYRHNFSGHLICHHTKKRYTAILFERGVKVHLLKNYSFVQMFCSSKYMFMSEIWDKLTNSIFWIFEISLVKRRRFWLNCPKLPESNMVFLANDTLQILIWGLEFIDFTNNSMNNNNKFWFHETNKTFSTSSIFLQIFDFWKYFKFLLKIGFWTLRVRMYDLSYVVYFTFGKHVHNFFVTLTHFLPIFPWNKIYQAMASMLN